MSQQLVVGSDVVVVYSQNYLDYIIAQVNSPIYNVYHPSCVDVQFKDRSSAANFVSRVLNAYEMITNPRVQIRILLEEMRVNGWVEYKNVEMNDLIPGDVILWEQDRSGHRHIGFVHENGLAVSFYGKKKFPILHELNFRDLWRGQERKVISKFTLQSKR